jgi:hypothetical protein
LSEEEREESRRERLERRRSSLDEKEIEDMLARICEDENNIGYIKAFVENRAVLPPTRYAQLTQPGICVLVWCLWHMYPSCGLNLACVTDR